MKLNKLALLCAAACAGFAGQAMAQVSSVPAAQAIVDDAVANGRIVYISGASAVQGGLGEITNTLFQSGSRYYFTPSSASGRTASDYRAYAGKLQAAAGTWPAGSNVIIINRARGGSVWGVNAVARAESIESLNVSTASCTTGSGTSAAPFTCGLNERVPDAGVSDVAPKLFDDQFNTEGEPAAAELSPIELGRLSAQPIYGLAFGIPMTDNLPLFYLNKSIVSALMTGNYSTWDQVNAALDADDVLICRRVNGSGTQAVANMYFGNYPCGAGNPPADRDTVPTFDSANRTFVIEGATGGLNVIENSSSGDVRSCLNAAYDASVATAVAGATPGTFTITTNATTGVKTGAWSGTVGYTTYVTADRAGDPVGVAFRNGNAHKAVGVLSMDSLANSTASSKWTFRSLDGAGEIQGVLTSGVLSGVTTVGTGRLPTKDSYMDGTWDMQGWVSFNTPARTTGAKRALANAFVAAAKRPAVLAAQASLKFVAGAMPGTADATGTGNVLKAGYAGNDQCAPLTFQP